MDINQYSLPKWPQMKVTGVSVTPEQALEIIRRTDTFFMGHDGNNHEVNAKLRQLFYMPEELRDLPSPERFHNHIQREENWKEVWGYIQTEYVHNSWISCAFIGGPHGWCHPDGVISFEDNVGKWPSVQEISDDWQKLATAFPFLDLAVTLMDGEGGIDGESQPSPVISFKVANGQVEVIDSAQAHVGHVWRRRGRSLAETLTWRFSHRGVEHGLSPAQLQVFADKAKELFANRVEDRTPAVLEGTHERED